MVQMITKQVKEYSKRQRIDLNKNDGFTPGADVVIMTAKEYQGIKDNIINLTRQLRTTENKLYAKEDEIAIYKNQEQNLTEMMENLTAPIYENHAKELSKKDIEIKRLQLQLKALETKTNQYNLDMQGLNAIEILILRKHKKLIQNFNDEIAIIGDDPKIIDADAKAIPGKDDAAKDQEQ